MAARGLAILARSLGPKLLKAFGKTVGTAVAGTAVSKVANKLFGGSRRRR